MSLPGSVEAEIDPIAAATATKAEAYSLPESATATATAAAAAAAPLVTPTDCEHGGAPTRPDKCGGDAAAAATAAVTDAATVNTGGAYISVDEDIRAPQLPAAKTDNVAIASSSVGSRVLRALKGAAGSRAKNSVEPAPCGPLDTDDDAATGGGGSERRPSVLDVFLTQTLSIGGDQSTRRREMREQQDVVTELGRGRAGGEDDEAVAAVTAAALSSMQNKLQVSALSTLLTDDDGTPDAGKLEAEPLPEQLSSPLNNMALSILVLALGPLVLWLAVISIPQEEVDKGGGLGMYSVKYGIAVFAQGYLLSFILLFVGRALSVYVSFAEFSVIVLIFCTAAALGFLPFQAAGVFPIPCNLIVIATPLWMTLIPLLVYLRQPAERRKELRKQRRHLTLNAFFTLIGGFWLASVAYVALFHAASSTTAQLALSVAFQLVVLIFKNVFLAVVTRHITRHSTVAFCFTWFFDFSAELLGAMVLTDARTLSSAALLLGTQLVTFLYYPFMMSGAGNAMEAWVLRTLRAVAGPRVIPDHVPLSRDKRRFVGLFFGIAAMGEILSQVYFVALSVHLRYMPSIHEFFPYAYRCSDKFWTAIYVSLIFTGAFLLIFVVEAVLMWRFLGVNVVLDTFHIMHANWKGFFASSLTSVCFPMLLMMKHNNLLWFFVPPSEQEGACPLHG